MMSNDSHAILDDILSRWHAWARGYRPVIQSAADPMFREARSSKQWDSMDDVIDEEITSKIMKAVDFQVSEMKDPHRAAIHALAKNCYAGHSVWISPRLPSDQAERAIIVLEARNQLMRRLMAAGVLQ